MTWEPVRKGQERGQGWLAGATQVVGLFAGLATVVYLTGGVVVALRLAFQSLPFANVVSQLPREFLISVGAGQVLLPALLVGAAYAFFRLLRAGRAEPPGLRRWRAGGEWRRETVRGYGRTFAFVAIPPLFILALRLLGNDFPWSELSWEAAGMIGGGLLLFAGVAVAVHETRAAMLSSYRATRRWNTVKAVAVMALIYAAASVPSMMAAAAAVPLTSVRVCDVDNFSEHGFLVGEAGDRIYIGEEGRGRRIAVIPMTKVAELFIGDDAPQAHCEIVSAPLTPDERREIEKRENSDRSNSFLTP